MLKNVYMHVYLCVRVSLYVSVCVFSVYVSMDVFFMRVFVCRCSCVYVCLSVCVLLLSSFQLPVKCENDLHQSIIGYNRMVFLYHQPIYRSEGKKINFQSKSLLCVDDI